MSQPRLPASAICTRGCSAKTPCNERTRSSVAAATAEPSRPTPRFERCVDDILAGDAEAVAASLRSYPDLVTMRSHWGHRATLLHYLAASGAEIYRQRANAPELARLLLGNGADVAAKANMYGGGRATLGMLLSSSHPAQAGVTARLADVLRQAGATRA